ncbi:putative oxidoreductase [Leptospira meyeri]|uniref:Putative oxidoreductase n=1 Tax=Leptospira meyeri TaxID=29508 RepID=A0A4R8MJJ3_LEPME|nr:DoxX family protein [Leptospira meyeri]EKJ88301.1 DoxX family protein [Leptospira meyeri serovar Hardjo str. Went 5]TDY67170.1 putative oxidoreductase [Leptospira meyeri]TGL53677.1 DoxX family protein [Leptospira meyeri]
METILRILSTDGSWSSLVLRIALGSVIWMHGAQKLLGIFGGYGFSGTMDFFTKTMGLPWIIALLVILGEFFGGIGLVFGIGTRFFALYTGTILMFAMFLVHWENGFFMNWFGNQKGEGIEFFILFLSISLTLILNGGGKYSLDSFISK